MKQMQGPPRTPVPLIMSSSLTASSSVSSTNFLPLKISLEVWRKFVVIFPQLLVPWRDCTFDPSLARVLLSCWCFCWEIWIWIRNSTCDCDLWREFYCRQRAPAQMCIVMREFQHVCTSIQTLIYTQERRCAQLCVSFSMYAQTYKRSFMCAYDDQHWLGACTCSYFMHTCKFMQRNLIPARYAQFQRKIHVHACTKRHKNANRTIHIPLIRAKIWQIHINL